jgi:Spx/MgsR family transcriptional regulator
MKVYGITTCGSVKKATNFLKNKNIEFEFVDLKKQTIDPEIIIKWSNIVGFNILFNTKGTKFKTLGLDKNLSDKEKLQWLQKEQLLFKRPIIEIAENDILVGFDEAIYQGKFC